MLPMNVPEPVMSLAIMPKTRDSSANFSKALNRFQKEDPTFKVSVLTATHGIPHKNHEHSRTSPMLEGICALGTQYLSTSN